MPRITNNNNEIFKQEYLCQWGITNNTTKLKEGNSVEERLNTYFNENGILVDSNGNFEMYIVIDADDKDHEVGSVFHGTDTEVYAEKRAYEDLKENNCGGYYNKLFAQINDIAINPYFSISDTKIAKKKMIKEELLALKDKMFKVLVNKENITNVKNNVVFVNKYKVVESVNLRPELKFKISSINDEKISILLYNSLTKKSKIIQIEKYNIDFDLTNELVLKDIKNSINEYLSQDENEVNLMNSLVEDGAAL
jgi:hypothetical protein